MSLTHRAGIRGGGSAFSFQRLRSPAVNDQLSTLSVFTKTESPAYAPASSGKMFPCFWTAAQRRLSLGRFAKAHELPP